MPYIEVKPNEGAKYFDLTTMDFLINLMQEKVEELFFQGIVKSDDECFFLIDNIPVKNIGVMNAYGEFTDRYHLEKRNGENIIQHKTELHRVLLYKNFNKQIEELIKRNNELGCQFVDLR